jgi:hypothetical protein
VLFSATESTYLSFLQHIDNVSRYEDAERRLNNFSASKSAKKFGC